MPGKLTRSIEFKRVLEQGGRIGGKRLVLYVLASPSKTRVGFVCGRGVGSAVARNRARRILKEAWRATAIQARSGFELVFVARPEIRGARMDDLVPEVQRMLSAGRVLQ